MIIVLSPSSHILSAECLTDPTGKSFTLCSPCQPSHETSFYLPASDSQSVCFNCSFCRHSLVLSSRKYHSVSLTISPRRCVISTRLRRISQDPAPMLSVYLTSINHRPSLFLRLSRSSTSVYLSLFSACDLPTLLFAACLTVLPRRIPACRLFDLITMPALVERERMSDTSLNDQPPFLLYRLLFVCQLFPSLNANLLPSTDAPAMPPPATPTMWVLAENRPLTGINRQTPVGLRHRRAVTHNTLHDHSHSCSSRSHVITETLIQHHNKRNGFVSRRTQPGV